MKKSRGGKKEKKEINTNIRYNIIMILVYIIGIVLLMQLFNLQIINGEEYREKSNTRLTRVATVEAMRGSILDRNGNEIVGNKMSFSLELYKSKLSTDELNQTILNIINVLDSNGDTYIDNFPINITEDGFIFTYSSEERIASWKKSNKLADELTAEECFYEFKKKYGIKNENISEVRKIIAIRYLISQNGYSSTKSIKISNNISRESSIQFNEQNSEFPGINVIVDSERTYNRGSLASHIIGYMGRITTDELEERKGQGYENSDYIGKTGIEYVFEDYLKGKDGEKQIDMAVDGTVTEEYITKEAIQGANVVLTIDAALQEVAQKALAENIEKIRNRRVFSKL